MKRKTKNQIQVINQLSQKIRANILSTCEDVDHVANAGATEIRLVDTITCKGLEPGKTYVAKGTLMNKKQ